MIWNVLYHLNEFPNDFLKYWDVHIWGLKDTRLEFFEHIKTTSGTRITPNMPSGVTGKYRIDLFLHDDRNDYLNRENSNRVQHELCHARLFGTAFFVDGVHNNGDRFTIKFWYWDKILWKRFQLSVIDIRAFI